MTKQVIIDISAAGSVQIDAIGFKGKGCAKATEQIEVVLGGKPAAKKKKKPEFFAPSGGGTKIKQTF